MRNCFPKHLCMGTARMKSDKETTEEELEKSEYGQEKRCPNGQTVAQAYHPSGVATTQSSD